MSATPIDRSQLQTLCELARINLPAEREAEVLEHLQRIVAAFAALREVPCEEVEGNAAPESGLRPRDDEPGPVLARDTALQNAPRTAADMFLVPRVVDA